MKVEMKAVCQVVRKQFDCIIAPFEGMFFSGLVLKNKPAALPARCTDGDVTLKAGRQAGRHPVGDNGLS